jgi:hypothetical protein
MQDDTSTLSNFDKLFDNLSVVENQIYKIYGGRIFDYVCVLSDNKRIKIEFPLILQNPQILEEYINIARQILIINSIELSDNFESLNITDKFIQISQKIFALRLIIAKQIYNKFHLIRILAPIEREIIAKNPELDNPDNTYAIEIDNFIITDQMGEVDLTQTKLLESQNFNIAIKISSLVQAQEIKDDFLEDFLDMTEFQFIGNMFKEQLQDLIFDLVIETMRHSGFEVYAALSRNIPLQEAINNQVLFYNKSIPAGTHQFPVFLERLERNLEQIFTMHHPRLDLIKKENKQLILNEMKELIMFYLKEGNIIPHNYYRLKFREGNPEDTYEQDFPYILEAYLLNDIGNPKQKEYPIETYSIEYNIESKVGIFNFVTNGIVNPYYTLDDYIQI